MLTTTELGTDATETLIETADPATTGDAATASLDTTAEVPTETGPNVFLPPMSVCPTAYKWSESCACLSLRALLIGY
jgi:hypothetical protein